MEIPREPMTMTEEQIKYMTDRFLAWKLPDNFNPDYGISYTRPNYPASLDGPSGTNLFDATQAEAMVRYMVEGIGAVAPLAKAPVTIEELEQILRDEPERNVHINPDGTVVR
jgi:hypothetical protein